MEKSKGNTYGIFQWKSATDVCNGSYVQSDHEEVTMNKQSDRYCDIYKDMADLLGETAVYKIWNRYAGQTINFPRKLLSRSYTKDYIRENKDTMKPSELAHELSLSERRVRQIISEIRRKKNE